MQRCKIIWLASRDTRGICPDFTIRYASRLFMFWAGQILIGQKCTLKFLMENFSKCQILYSGYWNARYPILSNRHNLKELIKYNNLTW